ncbi:hypothetical protein OIDMADRAFT_34783 [Oidiodendron maius Zn]|uniref:Uncharacterized protein n=1 Tax=Oidiodendron maius (strain Zn) TaxID=913774 RepID=A0A0C3CYL6_OIDMZ|nr:hypothetical protein OIDMADRAFT_34783 [Oidiodendron maius Zn]
MPKIHHTSIVHVQTPIIAYFMIVYQQYAVHNSVIKWAISLASNLPAGDPIVIPGSYCNGDSGDVIYGPDWWNCCAKNQGGVGYCAYTLEKSRDEQSKLLDLLEVLREFTENGRLQSASSIIASQVANVETATRQIETKVKPLTKPPAPALQQNPSANNYHKTTLHTGPALATVAAAGAPKNSGP